MTTWFTSDPHWGHEFVARTRGFDSAEAHDLHLSDVYADYFKPGDVVWWLGDLTMRMKPSEATLRCIDTQPEADHRLIYGNHDAGHPLHAKTHRHRQAYLRFGLAEPFAKARVSSGQDYAVDVRLSHFPYAGDHGEDRYSEWRLRDHGVPIVHGHTHSEFKVSRSDSGTVQVHVGWDAWRRPVRSDEVAALVSFS